MTRNRIYYTRGQSLMVGRDIYLVAYQARSSSSDNPWISMFMPGSVTRDSMLYLSLVNVSRSGGLVGIRQFDLKSIPERQEIADASDTVQTGDTSVIEVTHDVVIGDRSGWAANPNVPPDAPETRSRGGAAALRRSGTKR
jgi:hypothetical protein